MNINKIADYSSLGAANGINRNSENKAAEKASALAADTPQKIQKSDTFFTSGYIHKTEQKKTAITDDSDTKHLTEATDKDVQSYRRLVTKLMLKQSGDFDVTYEHPGLADVISRQITGVAPKFADSLLPIKLMDPSFPREPAYPALSKVSTDYWGASNTAKRLLDFGINLAGGDRVKLGGIKQAAIDGVTDAENQIGGKGKLSQVSYDTLDRLVIDFDEALSKLK